MVTLINIDFIVAIIFMFLDLIFIINPKVPLLNLFLGLLSAGVVLTVYSTLPLYPWFTLLIVVLTILVSFTGLEKYFKKGK